MPPLSRMLEVATGKPKKPQSLEEMTRVIEAMNLAFGGVDLRGKSKEEIARAMALRKARRRPGRPVDGSRQATAALKPAPPKPKKRRAG